MGSGTARDDLAEQRRRGRFAAAAESLRAAVRQTPADATLWLELGHMERLLGAFDRAEQAYEEALGIAEMAADGFACVDGMLGLAATWRGMGRLQAATGMLAEAADLIEELGDDESRPHLHWIDGVVHRFRGDLTRALAALQEGLRWAEQLGDREAVAYLQAALGGAYRVAGRDEASRRAYAAAYEVFAALEDAFGLAYTACGLGNAARLAGAFAIAEERYAEAAQRYETFGDRVSYAYTLWAWGTLAKLRGEYTVATERFGAAAELFRETGDRRGQGYAVLGILESELLAGDREAGDVATRARDEGVALERAGFPLEAAYARLLAALAAGEPPDDARAAIAAAGSAWSADALPLNLP